MNEYTAYWMEEKDAITAEVKEAYELCQIYGLDIGIDLTDILTADADNIACISVGLSDQVDKLKELHNKVYALADAMARLARG